MRLRLGPVRGQRLEALGFHRRHAILNLQRPFHEQIRLADRPSSAASVNRSGRTMMLAMPVSSSSGQKHESLRGAGPLPRDDGAGDPHAAPRPAARQIARAQHATQRELAAARAPSDAGRSSGSCPRSPPARARSGVMERKGADAVRLAIFPVVFEHLTGGSHRPFDLPERAAPIVAERVERTDLGERRQLVAAESGAGDQIFNGAIAGAGGQRRRSSPPRAGCSSPTHTRRHCRTPRRQVFARASTDRHTHISGIASVVSPGL